MVGVALASVTDRVDVVVRSETDVGCGAADGTVGWESRTVATASTGPRAVVAVEAPVPAEHAAIRIAKSAKNVGVRTRHAHSPIHATVEAHADRPRSVRQFLRSRIALRHASARADADAHPYFTSNLRTGDHAPATPAASTARTLHHMRVVGSVLME